MNHHDALGRLPPGGANDQPPFGNDGTGSSNKWGSSWMVYVLPYIEQDNLYRKWQFTGQSGAFNSNNNTAANGVIIKTYLCPSSPMNKFPAPSRPEAAMANYVTISGTAPGLIPGFTETRVNTYNSSGIMGGGGAMAPNSKTKITSIADGTSNTMMISEQGDFVTDNTGTKREWRACQLWGWYLGVKSPGEIPNFDNGGGDNRQPNQTTIRYTINYSPAGGWANDVPGLGVGSVGNSTGANVPLSSTHTGGVNAVFCDGSVRFIAQSTPLMTLARYATKDDGTVIVD